MMPERRLIEMSPQITKKKPPMVKAIREFVAAMEFPPTKKHGPNQNLELAAVVLAALMCCNNVEADATTVTGSPSLAQIAAILHCSTSTVKRHLSKLRDFGTLKTERRGTLSSVSTFHRSPKTAQQLIPQETGQQLIPQDTVDGSTQEPCRLNSPSLSAQLLPLSAQQLTPSGTSLDISLGKTSLEYGAGTTSNSPGKKPAHREETLMDEMRRRKDEYQSKLLREGR